MQGFYSGEYRHSLDAKSRVVLPSKFRKNLDKSVVIAPSLDRCLTIYTPEGFEKFYENLKTLPALNKKARDMVRYFIGNAFDVDIDSQGRIILPQKLKDTANITKDVVYVGVGSTIELWGAEEYDHQEEEVTRDAVNDIAAELSDKDGVSIPFI